MWHYLLLPHFQSVASSHLEERRRFLVFVQTRWHLFPLLLSQFSFINITIIIIIVVIIIIIIISCSSTITFTNAVSNNKSVYLKSQDLGDISHRNTTKAPIKIMKGLKWWRMTKSWVQHRLKNFYVCFWCSSLKRLIIIISFMKRHKCNFSHLGMTDWFSCMWV